MSFPPKATVADLKSLLTSLGLDTKGKKAELIERLTAHQTANQTADVTDDMFIEDPTEEGTTMEEGKWQGKHPYILPKHRPTAEDENSQHLEAGQKHKADKKGHTSSERRKNEQHDIIKATSPARRPARYPHQTPVIIHTRQHPLRTSSRSCNPPSNKHIKPLFPHPSPPLLSPNNG